MYLGNTKLRKSGELIDYTPEMQQEVIRCKEDIIYFAENYFTIVTIDEGTKIIKLHDFQKKMLKAMVNPPPEKNGIIIKIGRQSGKTTVASIYLLWKTLFHRDKTVAILANKEKTSIEILDRIKKAFLNLPLWLQQGIAEGGWNKTSIIFENGSRIFISGTSSDSISGFTVSDLYIDEFSKIPNHIAEEFITSTYPVISSGKTSKIIIASTPLGLNHFFEFWSKAVRGENSFFPIKVNYWEVPGRDAAWKQKMIKDIGNMRFKQEYMCKFLGSKSTLIDSDILESIIFREPIADKWTGLLAIYEKPIPNATYILGIDSSKGVQKDNSVIQVLKINSAKDLQQVAVYSNNQINPHDYAQVCMSVSEYYNNALMMIENNDMGSSVCNTIWYEYECDRIVNIDPKGLGIRSTKTSKLEANMLLKEYMEKGYLKIVDQKTVYELSRYEEITNNVFAASEYEKDDHVTALLWAVFFVITDFYDERDSDVKSIEDKYKIDEDNNVEGPVMIFT